MKHRCVGCIHFLILWEMESLNQNNFSHHLLSERELLPQADTQVNSLTPNATSVPDVASILGLLQIKKLGAHRD